MPGHRCYCCQLGEAQLLLLLLVVVLLLVSASLC
jgi:hypothetical protein